MHSLREWRRMKEITQQQMADELGIHVNTYQSWEEHPELISIISAVKISDILQVDFNDIIFYDKSLQNVE